MTARRLPATRATVATAGRGVDDEYLRPCVVDPLPFDLVLDHTRGPEHRAAVKACKAICGGCEVRETCLRENREHPSVIAGMTYQERLQAAQPCGTAAAYKRHYAHGDKPCGPCRRAHSKYQAEKRKKAAA